MGQIEKSTSKQSFQLIQGALHVFKCISILLLPYKPDQTSRHQLFLLVYFTLNI